MSESSNLQKISEAAYAKIVDKTNVQVVALTYIEEEADKRIEASLTNLLEKLAAMCQSCLAEAATLKSLTGEELTKTYEMLEDDLEATSLRINADYELKLRLTKESVDRLRQDYQGVLDQFTEAQTELAELMQDGTASVALTALSRFRLLGSGGEDMSDKIDGILSNLLDVEKDLSMKTAALTLEMLSTWKRDFAKSLAEVRKTVSDNRALALSSEERFRQLAGGYSRKALEEIDAKVEEFQRNNGSDNYGNAGVRSSDSSRA